MQNTIIFLTIALLAAIPTVGARADAPTPVRTLKICVAADASAPIQQAAQTVLDAVSQQPLLRVFAGDTPPTALTDTTALLAGKPPTRTYSHLVVIGLASDPVIKDLWLHDARTEDGGLYVFGFGHLRGNIGYIESGRNPYLHSNLVKVAPYETEFVTLTGSNEAGVVLAVNAFLHGQLVNGVIGGAGWTRGSTTILDRDPLTPSLGTPSFAPVQAGDATLLGWTQASEEEYRGVLADTNLLPTAIWRAKYYAPGAWDGAGDQNALLDYSNGLHRRAYGNTLWCARFATDAAASSAAPRIAAAARLASDKQGRWKGMPTPLGHGTEQSNPLILWRQGPWVFMSTLPEADTQVIEKVSLPEDAAKSAVKGK